MLIFSLAASVAVLLYANLTVFYPKRFGRPVYFPLAIPALFILGCGVIGFPPAYFVAATLSVAMVPWMLGWAKPRTFLPVSLTAFTIVRTGTGYHAWIGYEEYRRLAEKYPFVSLEHRLPPRAVAGAEDSEGDYWRTGFRDRGLQVLHEELTRLFVNSPGFGVTRMNPQRDAVEWVKRFDKADAVVPQPEPSFSASLAATDAVAKETPRADGARALHSRALELFLDPEAFGYVRSRKETAGFVGHRFSKLPADGPRDDVRSIDLIGLLLHPEPVAYMSANLPRMDELRDAPMRPLTPFEADAIKRLRRGEELVAATAGDRVRAVGAIRNGRRCMTCHDGNEGDLLGAFSYVLAAAQDNRRE